jgi:hypothetical protein
LEQGRVVGRGAVVGDRDVGRRGEALELRKRTTVRDHPATANIPIAPATREDGQPDAGHRLPLRAHATTASTRKVPL